jgi:hypothetical protein
MDSSIVTFNTNTGTVLALNTALGSFQGEAGGSGSVLGYVVPYSSTYIRITGFFGGASNIWGSASNALSNTTVKMGGFALVPITGWQP